MSFLPWTVCNIRLVTTKVHVSSMITVSSHFQPTSTITNRDPADGHAFDGDEEDADP